MERKKLEKVKIFGKTVYIQDSDDDEPHIV